MISGERGRRNPPLLNTGPPVDGLYAPSDYAATHIEPATIALISRIGAEAVMLPPVAAAVLDRKTFERDPGKRAKGTLRSGLRLSLSNPEGFTAEAQRLWQLHNGIRGVYISAEGQHVKYNANDPVFQTWVGMCIWDSIELAGKLWGTPLNTRREAAYRKYVDGFITHFGIDPAHVPTTTRDYDAYREEKIAGEELLWMDEGRGLAKKILTIESARFRPVTNVIRAVATTTLDPRLQERIPLIPTPEDEERAERFNHRMKKTYGRTPEVLRKGLAPTLYTALGRAKSIANRASALNPRSA